MSSSLTEVTRLKKQGQIFWVGKIAHAHETATAFIVLGSRITAYGICRQT